MSATPENGSMSGRVCVVTGATSGIGYVSARELARRGASVVAIGRDPTRLSDAIQRISSAVPTAMVHGLVADLFLQSEIRRVAAEIEGRYPRVHVLVNNAGALFSRREVTAEGFERTWALNVIAPFLLTHLLLPRLQASAPARIVNVASTAHRGATLDFENLQGEVHYAGYRAYSRSKLAIVLLTHEFARRLDHTRETANALHPGFVASRFGRNNSGGVGAAIGVLAYLFGISPERGARTVVFLASDPSVETVTGKYFVRGRAVASSSASYDTVTASRLWDVLALQTGIPTDVLSKPA